MTAWLMFGVAPWTVVAGCVSRPGEVRFGQGMPVPIDQSGRSQGVAVDRRGSAPASVSIGQGKLPTGTVKPSRCTTSKLTVLPVAVFRVSTDR